MNAIILIMLLVFLPAAAGVVKADDPAASSEKQADQPMLGQEAPLFSLKSLAGETVALKSLRGKFVVIHFGAGW